MQRRLNFINHLIGVLGMIAKESTRQLPRRMQDVKVAKEVGVVDEEVRVATIMQVEVEEERGQTCQQR